MIYSDSVPASATTTDVATPAPWVPWTRAGCDVGDVSTANMVLENAGFDIPKVFGPDSPEAAQLNADTRGPAVLQPGDRRLRRSRGALRAGEPVLRGRGGGQVRAEHAVADTAVADVLPDEPGGYTGYQALFGHKYIAPQLGAGDTAEPDRTTATR